MTLAEERPEAATTRSLPVWGFGLANLAVVAVLSIVSWWLLVDPQWSAFGLYPQPYTAILFWTILATVWVAFTFGWLGPASWPQPWRGLFAIVLTLVNGIGIMLLLAYGWGAVDPSFSASREGGAGFTTGNLFVLFGFFFYVLSAVSHANWPWSAATHQPWTGLGQLTLVFLPTLIAYLVLALPNVASWAQPDAALLSLPVVIGWFYSLVVATVVTGLLAENRPWSLAKRPGAVAAAALVGNAALGTLLFLILVPVAQVLMGSANVAALGAAVPSHAAELACAGPSG
jgi:AAT family amino acid transporter